VLVPDAQANLARIPADLTDEEVLMCPDIMSTGISAAETGRVRVGDLAKIHEAYDLFSHQRDRVLEVAIRP